jgi:hypothetical protein
MFSFFLFKAHSFSFFFTLLPLIGKSLSVNILISTCLTYKLPHRKLTCVNTNAVMELINQLIELTSGFGYTKTLVMI